MRFTKQIVLLFLLSSSFLNAEVIRNLSLHSGLDVCVYNDYYLASDGKYYFHDASDNSWFSTMNFSEIYQGFVYDTTTLQCRLDDHNVLGLTNYDFNFLLALVGSFVGFTILFFVIFIFINVGGGRRWS